MSRNQASTRVSACRRTSAASSTPTNRLRPFSNNRFTPAARRSRIAQVEELINTARVSVFFIDGLQVVRPGEIGSSSLIRDAAEAQGDAQFRCNGSEAFINWVDNTLQIRRTPNVMWDSRDPFEFRIVDSVQELERLIRRRHADGFTARLSAGFCWNWSDPTPAGQLVPDVKVGNWSMPWNAKPDAGRLAAGIPSSNFWASDPRGINQVGCVYTAQGFDGGTSASTPPPRNGWAITRSRGTPQVRRSGDAFLALVKNIYRVLLTRGLNGCYVFFQDEATRAFVRSRIE